MQSKAICRLIPTRMILNSSFIRVVLPLTFPLAIFKKYHRSPQFTRYIISIRFRSAIDPAMNFNALKVVTGSSYPEVCRFHTSHLLTDNKHRVVCQQDHEDPGRSKCRSSCQEVRQRRFISLNLKNLSFLPPLFEELGVLFSSGVVKSRHFTIFTLIFA